MQNTRFENTTDRSGDTIEGIFLNQNGGANGGGIYNNGANAKLGDINADFIGNYASSSSDNAGGGAIYNYNGTIGTIDESGNLSGGIINSSFINNYAKSEKNSSRWCHMDK